MFVKLNANKTFISLFYAAVFHMYLGLHYRLIKNKIITLPIMPKNRKKVDAYKCNNFWVIPYSFSHISYEKRIRNAIINAKRPTASVNANPSIAYLNRRCSSLGLRDNPNIKEPKTIPTPVPAPASPIVASPAPTAFPEPAIALTKSCLKVINDSIKNKKGNR